MNVEHYQRKAYEPADRPCWSLVSDVLMTERGVSVDVCKTVSGSLRAAASAFRLELHKGSHGFERIADPVDFAVVLMGRTEKLGIHHCGIYYAGKVLHAEAAATWYQDLASLRDEYLIMEFWTK